MNSATPVRVTNVHRQPRPADPDLANLDRRIAFLESHGDTRSRAWAVALLRRRWQHLERDKESRPAGWYTDGANLALAIEREERYRSPLGGTVQHA